ncbi:hypothetical protein OGAPHI_004051 [Ogataea philodendri]|uniref:Uncharacterized protein n=1 Tax=Ogataea philodendri TaxID=1378263 RepID=A0A9P8P5G4_9ASCO|nr:uncharacterized protein OGAPHI_004051 [Ogataea philodendri]KAH3665863.1 hypothetical protein OGAPHI_004051 [Ogataea philodendri]
MSTKSSIRRSFWGPIRGSTKSKEKPEKAIQQEIKTPRAKVSSRAGTGSRASKRQSMVIDPSELSRAMGHGEPDDKENLPLNRSKHRTVYEEDSDGEDADITADSSTVLEILDMDTNDTTTLLDTAFDDYKIALQALSLEDNDNPDQKLALGDTYNDTDDLKSTLGTPSRQEQVETRVIERVGFTIVGTEFITKDDENNEIRKSFFSSDYDNLFDDVELDTSSPKPIQRTSLYFGGFTDLSR